MHAINCREKMCYIIIVSPFSLKRQPHIQVINYYFVKMVLILKRSCQNQWLLDLYVRKNDSKIYKKTNKKGLKHVL